MSARESNHQGSHRGPVLIGEGTGRWLGPLRPTSGRNMHCAVRTEVPRDRLWPRYAKQRAA